MAGWVSDSPFKCPETLWFQAVLIVHHSFYVSWLLVFCKTMCSQIALSIFSIKTNRWCKSDLCSDSGHHPQQQKGQRAPIKTIIKHSSNLTWRFSLTTFPLTEHVHIQNMVEEHPSPIATTGESFVIHWIPSHAWTDQMESVSWMYCELLCLEASVKCRNISVCRISPCLVVMGALKHCYVKI